MKIERCGYHDELVTEIAEVKTDVKWLIKREEEKQDAWEKRELKKESKKRWLVGIVLTLLIVLAALLELFQ